MIFLRINDEICTSPLAVMFLPSAVDRLAVLFNYQEPDNFRQHWEGKEVSYIAYRKNLDSLKEFTRATWKFSSYVTPEMRVVRDVFGLPVSDIFTIGNYNVPDFRYRVAYFDLLKIQI